ncbi:ABC transporter ATP-binding protein [Tessaracoccus oleiagri]|uniref:ABC-type quaternary amine transporter n=1 Tax=Tessaracoccus oleiagri TaxID=686624 RepID=A0A1G9MWT2_9ACTN|nr:ABC transporter ATP-binding protein [Tessaracoccus oleiagri]SDL78679.1 thiamine transport system ATP-binding protein [Tessaracoccus oleiagri]
MSGLAVDGVTVRYGDKVAVDQATFTLEPGHVLALLGASGSGKSSLLRAIVGFEPIASGRVCWDGQDLSTVKVHKRRFGLVFQDGQLFPTMTVAKNIAYGLGALDRLTRRRRVQELLELVGLPGYGDRKPDQLSGGEAQRVALARALAPNPRAIFLDEPLSALDTGLRRRLADDLSRILRETGTTAVYVSHDQEEAFAVADSVAVMADGRILQREVPDELWNRPTNKQVAAFLGFRTFITQATAAALGWDGRLEAGYVLGIGPRSLDLDERGVEVPVLGQSMTVDHYVIEVRLPDGQQATVAAPKKADADHVRVTLTSGAVTPA